MDTSKAEVPLRWHGKLFFKIVVPVLALFIIGGITTAIVLPQMQSRHVVNAATSNAVNTANLFKTLRKYYVENVVSEVLAHSSIKPSIEHKDVPATIPLPATMIHDMSALISKDKTQLKLYSPYPFPNRKERQLDDFAREAWSYLKDNPGQTFSKTETSGGVTKVRTAIADTMVNASCTGCHNTHPDTPKTGWEIGDVRGVLEIDTEIDDQLAEGAATSNRVLLILMSISLCVIGLIWLLLKHRVIKPIKQSVSLARSVAESDFDTHVEIRGNDETTHLTRSLVEMRDTLRHAAETDNRVTELARINLALESVASSVLLLDEQCSIIYMNDSAKKLVVSLKHPSGTALFSLADQLLDTDITEIYNEDAQTLKADLAGLAGTLKTTQTVGAHTLDVISTPVTDADGSRLGTVIEWVDRTEELAIESEVQGIVKSALEGDLDQRIESNNKQGFIRLLSESVNELVAINRRVIDDTIDVMRSVSEGNLTRTIDTQYKGSFEQLRTHINNTISKLTEVTQKIDEGSRAVLSGAVEISSGNSNLNRRTEEQAAHLEETASSMEELTSTVRQNAKNAKRASELAGEASSKALSGSSVVGNAISAMDEITDSSRQIADIIGVIDEIAFQTNLLALNASVEAARAGEQGRGFAVVASEVRNLAGRSASAASEIKELIESSVDKVNEGSRLVGDSGRTLQEITDSVKQVTEIIAEITAASEEQYEGIDQINKAIASIDEMTQKNAALVEEGEASSELMNQQASNLTDLISFFSTADRSFSRKEQPLVVAPKVVNSATVGTQNPEPFKPASGHVALKVVSSDSDDEWDEF